MKSCLLLAFALTATAASAVDYKSQVAIIFRTKCYACHSVTKKVKGKLALDDDKISEQIGPGKNIIPGKGAQSTMYVNCTLPNDDGDVMPPEGKNRLTDAELATLKAWIDEGANLTGGGAAPAAAPTAAPAAGGVMKWTNTEGKTIEAEFMGLEGDSVLLKIPSTGITHILPLSKLSAESQAQAKAAKK
ncbi:c-type cytochrome domain-containing protein [Prosthecobacter sp.]|uniref:c-type cytochrome domain-containing protein n=1 Tax=Prosthecobacter sp. TaxID=1965333 RepID=UPI00378323BA